MTMPEAFNEPQPVLRVFDTFEIGQHCGRATLALDENFVSRIEKLFGPPLSAGRIHMSVVPLLLMRAFTTIVDNRPPGNLHVGQICELFELPCADTLVDAEVICRNKEIKRDRRILAFEVNLLDPEKRRNLISGLTTIFWAA
jgi:hypothetical protein